MRNLGYVVNVDIDKAEVVLGEHLTCEGCGACVAVMGGKQRKLVAANDIGAQIGQKVEIEIPPRYAVGAAFLLFIFPLMAALGGGLPGYHLAHRVGLVPEVGAIVLGGVSLMISYLVVKAVGDGLGMRRLPRIVRTLTDNQPPEGGC
jgi:sigma-E factor negative regulatory protein RseC